MSLAPDGLDSLRAILLGFAFAGLVGSSFELAFGRPVSFKLLQTGDAAALASVPLLIVCAPFVIVRNSVRGRLVEGRPFAAVLAGTVVAGLWSLMCGRLVLDAASLLAGA